MIMLYNNAFVLLRKNKICVRFVLARDIYIYVQEVPTHTRIILYIYIIHLCVMNSRRRSISRNSGRPKGYMYIIIIYYVHLYV
jgi:hypothetical protein